MWRRWRPSWRSAPIGEGRERDGWEEHRRRQIRDVLSTTPAQRLAWVEEMIDLVARLRPRARQEKPASSAPPPAAP
ncbi:MAG: hypothetical protein M3245_04830 [Actinomycetota bacterium]|nr:hypothetical protein [Actinomycetota bacterium]